MPLSNSSPVSVPCVHKLQQFVLLLAPLRQICVIFQSMRSTNYSMMQTVKTAMVVMVALLALQLAACASMSTTAPAANAPAQPPGLTGDLLYRLLTAEFAGNSGDLKTATENYAAAAAQTTDHRVTARATYIAIYSGDYPQALKLLDQWKQQDAEDVEVDRMYATAYLKLKQPQPAARAIQRILDRATTDDNHNKALAVKNLLQKEADDETALAVLEELNQQDAGNTQMLVLQSRYAAQLENYDAALALLDKALLLDPEESDIYVIKSRILTAQGKTEQALAVIAMVLEKRPDDITLRLQYSRMLVEAQQLVAAREQFHILLDKQPDNADVLLSLGLLYIDIKELDQAGVFLRKLIELDQKTHIANYYLGRIAHSQNKIETAISYYLKVAEGDYAFDARMRIAGLFAQLGRQDEALQQLATLAEAQTEWPNRVKVYLAEGEILRSQHKYRESFEMYSRVLMQKPDDPDLLYARAIIAEKVDRIDITETDLLKVLSAEPENANALNALGYTLADRTGRLKEALDYIHRAAQLIPDDPAILDSLGWVSYRLGKMEDALKWLGQAFEKLADPEIAAHYGEVLWQSNQRERAKEVWQRGRELDAKHPVLVETLKRYEF